MIERIEMNEKRLDDLMETANHLENILVELKEKKKTIKH